MNITRLFRKRTKPAEVITHTRCMDLTQAAALSTANTDIEPDSNRWTGIISKLTHWGVIK